MLVRLCVAVSLPILASTVMAIHNGWTPVGDNATLAIRTGDVLRGDPPLTGMITTADAITDADELNHPGPLEVWVAAVPYALFGPTGLLLTIAAANAAALMWAVVVSWRRGGPPLAVWATAIGLLLCWSLGTTVIRDPLNTHLQLLPWFLLIVLCWDIRLGHWRSLPVAVAVGSWVAQAHVIYVPMTLILGVGTAAMCLLDQRRRSPEERERAAVGRRQSLIWAVTVGLVLSLPMLIDQVRGDGNLGKMLGFADQAGQGLVVGLRTLLTAFGAPPAWLQTTNEPFILLRGPSTFDVLAFLATAALVGWGLVTARRREDRLTQAMVQVALVAVAAALVAVVRTPRGGAVLAADSMNLLRPVSAALWLGLGWGVWQAVEPSVAPRLAERGARTATIVVGSVAALALVAVTVFAPAKFGGYGEGLMGPIARIEPEVRQSVRGQPMVQVNASGWAARLYLRHSVIEDLERHGIATRTDDDGRVFRRDGKDRRPPTATLWVVSDPVEPQPPDADAVLVARGDLMPGGGLSDAGLRRQELRRTLDEAGSIQLKDSERYSVADVSREFFRWKTPPPEGQRTLPAEWVSVDSFVELHRHGLIASPDVDDALIDDIVDDSLGRFFAAEDMEVAVYLRMEPTS